MSLAVENTVETSSSAEYTSTTNTSGLIKSLNKSIANFDLKHSEESLLYSQATFKVVHVSGVLFYKV